MKVPLRIPVVSPVWFWDTDPKKINYTVNADEVIVRIFNYGTDVEVKEIIKCYGADYVSKILINETNIHGPAFERGMSILNIPPQNFKCYGKKLFRSNYWKI